MKKANQEDEVTIEKIKGKLKKVHKMKKKKPKMKEEEETQKVRWRSLSKTKHQCR
jgi:hypothetical protein